MKNKFAIVSLILGAVSFLQLFGAEKAILAIIFGILALKEIKSTPQVSGKNLAIIGIILSMIYIATAIFFGVKYFPTLIAKVAG